MDRELMMSVTTAGPALVAPTNPGTPVTHRHELVTWSQEVKPRLLKALEAFDWNDVMAFDMEVVFLGVHTSGVNMFRFDVFENLELKAGRLEEAPEGWREVDGGTVEDEWDTAEDFDDEAA